MDKKNSILIIILLIILILAVTNFELSLIIKIISAQTISGLSSGKIIFFIISLLGFIVLSKLNIKTKAPKRIFIFGAAIFLGLLSLFSFFVFIQENSLPVFEYFDIVYGKSTDSFTWNSLTHIHSFKPAMFPFVKEKIFDGFDFGLEYYHYMPEWFSIIYYFGFVLFLFFSWLFVKDFLFLKQKNKTKNIIFYAGTYFLLIDSFFDSGPINHMFFAGILGLLYLSLNENTQKHFTKKFGLIITPIVLLISFFTPLFLSIRSFLILFSYNSFFSTKEKKLKFYFLILIILTIFLSLSYGTRLLTNYEYYNTTVNIGEKVLVNPLIIEKGTGLVEIEKRGFLTLYSIDKNIKFKDFLKIKNNEGLLNEVMSWEGHCDFFKEKHKMKVYSNTTPKSKSYHKLLTNITYKVEGEKSYLLSFESSTCLKSYKTIIANYLREEGIEKFIVSD